MFGLGIPEILIIVLVIGVLFFGSKKMTEFARSMGRFSGEFKKGKEDMARELREVQDNSVEEKKSDTAP